MERNSAPTLSADELASATSKPIERLQQFHADALGRVAEAKFACSISMSTKDCGPQAWRART